MVAAFVLHRPPLDEVGWINLPQDAQIRKILSSEIGPASGLYVYPKLVGIDADSAGAAQAAYSEALKTGPSGFLLYRSAGDAVDPERGMVEELLKTFVVATLASLLLASTTGRRGYLFRFGFVAVIGAIASSSTHISYHAWFGFPAAYTLARIALDVVPWIAGSLVIAALVRPRDGDAPARIQPLTAAR